MNWYYLSIPIVIGISVGVFLVEYQTDSNESKILTSEKLIENGSPVMGNIDAAITILEWGITNVPFVTNFTKIH